MPTQITQRETDGHIVLHVEGDLLVSDALLLERIAGEAIAESGKTIKVDLADLDFLDSESAAILRRLHDRPEVELQGLEIFLQSAIDLAERSPTAPDISGK